MMFKDKKAGEKMLSIWWFVVLALIGAGIVGGTLIFYSEDVDVRKAEADILVNKISECLISQGELIKNYDDNFDVINNCYLNPNLFEKNSNYYVRISFSGKFKERILGAISFEKDCNIQETILKAEYFPRCVEKKLEIFSGKDKIEITIRAGSNYLGGEK